MKAVETEVWTVIRLIQSKSIEKVASILKNSNYRVYRDNTVLPYIDITAFKDIGKSGLRIEISKEEIRAFSTDLQIHTSLFRNYSLETEFWTVFPLIENKSVEEVVSILKNLNYCAYTDIWHGPRHGISIIISTYKKVGKLDFFITINTRIKELWAYGHSHDKRLWSVIFHPFYNYGKEQLLKDIRKSQKYLRWRYACLDRDFGRCKNCGIDTEKAYSLGDKLDVHHIKSLIKIVEESDIRTLTDAEKCDVLWDLDNGLTLCGFCHRRLTKLQKLTLRREKIFPLSGIIKSKT